MDRAVSPVVAVVLLVGITVVGAAGVAGVVTGLDAGTDPTTGLAFTVSVDADTQKIALAHRGSEPLDLRECALSITVDGDPLAEQPPVPYFAAPGFEGTPTGPFNSGGDPVFDPGERASLNVASTNAPLVEPGDRVTVTITRGDRRLTSVAARATEGPE